MKYRNNVKAELWYQGITPYYFIFQNSELVMDLWPLQPIVCPWQVFLFALLNDLEAQNL